MKKFYEYNFRDRKEIENIFNKEILPKMSSAYGYMGEEYEEFLPNKKGDLAFQIFPYTTLFDEDIDELVELAKPKIKGVTLEIGKPKNWHELGECQRIQHMTRLFNYAQGQYILNKDGAIKYKKVKNEQGEYEDVPEIDLKANKRLNELAKRFYKKTKEIYQTHKEFREFLICAAAQEANLGDACNEELRQKYLKMAHIEFSLSDNFKSDYQRISSYFRFVDFEEIEANEINVLLTIDFARDQLEIAKNKLKKDNEDLVNLDEYYEKLTDYQNIVENAEEYINSKIFRVESKSFFEEDARRQKSAAAYEMINKYTTEINLDGKLWFPPAFDENEFFENEKNLTDEQKMKRLHFLKLALILTRSDIKDFLIQGNKELEVSKTATGKIEITISDAVSLSEDFSINKNGTKITTKENTLKNSITYVFDSFSKEVEGYKISGQYYAFDKDVNKDLKAFNLDVETFLGNIESSFNIDFKTVFNKRVPVVSKVKSSANLFKLKEKIKTKNKTKHGFTLEQNAELTAGNLDLKGYSFKPSLVSLSAGIDASKDAKKLSAKFSTGISSLTFNNGIQGLIESFKENTDNKLLLNFFTYNIDKSTLNYGTSYNQIFAIPVKWENGLPKINSDEPIDNIEIDVYERCKLLVDKVRMLLAQTKGDKDTVFEIVKENDLADLINDDGKSINVKKAIASLAETMTEHKKFIEELKEYKGEIDSKKYAFLDKEGLDKIFAILAKNDKEKLHSINKNSVEIYNENNFKEALDAYFNNEIGTDDIINIAEKIAIDAPEKNLESYLEAEPSLDNLKRICELFKKVKNIENFYSAARAADLKYTGSKDFDYEEHTVLNAYNKVIKEKLVDLIKDERYVDVFKITKGSRFVKELTDVINSLPKNERKEIKNKILQENIKCANLKSSQKQYENQYTDIVVDATDKY